MSKFFEALEQAEQDRVRKEEAEQRASGEPAVNRENPPSRLTRVSPAESASISAPPYVAASKPHVTAGRPRAKRIPAHEPAWQVKRAPKSGLDDHLVSILDPMSAEAEQYRTLCCGIEQAHRDANLSIVAITSPGVGDGKTLTAINLAATLAQAPENRVLLIDADLRNPSVGHQVGIDNWEGPGLIDAILNPDFDLRDVERPLFTSNLSVVTAGQSFDSPYETLKSPRLQALLEDARLRYDYVVVDTPPLVPVPDCRLIGRWVEGFLIVVAAHYTPKKSLEEALNIVEPAKVIGIVFNGDDQPMSDYYNYSYVASRSSHRNDGWGDRLTKRLAAFSRTPFPLGQK
jgi:capsular exopolysaccharide synthesis family protein